MDITLDTNVLIRAFQPEDKVRERERLAEVKKARRLYEQIARGLHLVIIPECVLVEFCAVYSRLTNPSLALRAVEQLREMVKIVRPCVKPDFYRVVALIDHTFDAVPLAVAHLYGTTFITADEGLYRYLVNRGLSSRLGVELKLLKELRL